jgi:hypothetical protein
MPSLIFIPRFEAGEGRRLRRFLNFVVADAARASAEPLVRSVDYRAD